MDLKSLVFRRLGVSPNGFKVDDVTASSEKLRTSDLLSVLSRQLGREVIVSPLIGRRMVESGIRNSLISAVDLAFRRHLPLTLSPDAIWLTIVQGFSHHVTRTPRRFAAG